MGCRRQERWENELSIQVSNGQVQIRMGKWKSGLILSAAMTGLANGLDWGGRGGQEEVRH